MFKGNTPPEEEWKPAPAESFEIEFLNTGRVSDHFADMGFILIRTVPEGDRVRMLGKSTSGDGTTIEIIVTKGDKYKSPREIKEGEIYDIGKK